MCGPGFPDTPGRSCGELLHRRPAYEVVGAPVSSLQRAILERMLDERPQADRIIIAQLHGEAKHHAKWRELTEDEYAAAVATLRELAAGRTDLLAYVAGILEGSSEGQLDEPLARQAAGLCRAAGPTRRRSRRGSRRDDGAGITPAGRRSRWCPRLRLRFPWLQVVGATRPRC